ncbi:hypothetical protein BCR34DRAFT_75745 [Clohesyomyces aquaticus]|uniref:C2H2-type domain-containing protein n=1 Tax=Clohesyomyces aquaticus TaxID=1231657 RepID=A0A1Y2A3C2_9PLEO|nr:hypothetical protein BCR34DRAFT_75745 [Clohesyomyces aquaticus]
MPRWGRLKGLFWFQPRSNSACKTEVSVIRYSPPQMSPAGTPRRQSVLHLQCDICHRQYHKKEHLQRHERTHTGDKPFACQVCGRNFARQDALNRHARVHAPQHNVNGNIGSISSSAHGSGSGSFSPVSVGVNSPSIDSATGRSHLLPTPGTYPVPHRPSAIPPHSSNHVFNQTSLQSPGLFWPDSESLLQNIMSLDPALWEQPMALMPPVLESIPPFPRSASEDGEGSANSTAGEGHRAIQTLSALISNTVNDITTPAALAQLTSRFLDSCLHMFFSTFIPMLPVIHRPTFVFRECSPPLLLNAIAIGSLFLGTSEASAKGDVLWRLAHTAVATSWHTMINQRGEHDSCNGVQLVITAFLSQTYAALAKSRTLRMTSQVFHGLGIYWARYCGLFDLPALAPIPSFNDPPDIKYRAWRVWLAREAQLRTLLGLYILDGVISQFSGNPTFAQHMSNVLPTPSDECTFNASTHDEWLDRLLQRNPHQTRMRFCDIFRKLFQPHDQATPEIPHDLSLFSLKVVLEGLKSLVAESKRIEPAPIGVPPPLEINEVLDRLRRYVLVSRTLTQVEKLTAMLRWHAICLDALGNTARGARRLCFALGIKQQIFGGGERLESEINPSRWISSDPARRSLLHAAEIQHIASQLPLGLAHDPHVPGAVFAAATTFASFAMAGRTRVVFPNKVDWQIVLLLPKDDQEWRGAVQHDHDLARNTMTFITGKMGDDEGRGTIVRDLSYELSAMRLLLRGLSLQWGVSSEMEEVVEAWTSKCS